MFRKCYLFVNTYRICFTLQSFVSKYQKPNTYFLIFYAIKVYFCLQFKTNYYRNHLYRGLQNCLDASLFMVLTLLVFSCPLMDNKQFCNHNKQMKKAYNAIWDAMMEKSTQKINIFLVQDFLCLPLLYMPSAMFSSADSYM